MFAKLQRSIGRTANIILIELVAALVVAEAIGDSYNNVEVLHMNQFDTGLTYDQPPVKYLKQQQQQQLNEDPELYNRQSNIRDQSHERYSDDTESIHPAGGGETDEEHPTINSQPSHHETMLSESITISNRENPINNNNNNNEQMNENNPLQDKQFLNRDLIRRSCQIDRGTQRIEPLNNTFLTYCSRYKLEDLLSTEILMSIMHYDTRGCERVLDEFIQLDETIYQFDTLFVKLLSRYNCLNGYSVKWNCGDCMKAYRDWLCASHLPIYMNGERIKPCISFCERVEQRCPYLHPITREQYGGQPVFICRDPNIPFVPAITPDIPYSDPGQCYDLCHLSDNLTELIVDSLSKYDYDKCPDRSSIAREAYNQSLISKVAVWLKNKQQQEKLRTTPLPDNSDVIDESLEEDASIIANRTDSTGHKSVLIGHGVPKRTHVHTKKLEDLREVLANYKNQAKTHIYHSDHSSIEHSKPRSDLHTS